MPFVNRACQILFTLAALAVLFSSSVRADTMITLNATNSGFYHQSGTFVSTGNYAVGLFQGQPPGELRDYFVFNLTGIIGTITSATLRAFNPSTGFSSPDPNETLTLFDVSTNISTLSAGTGGVPAFNDLGSGTIFGSRTVDFTSNNANVDVPINTAGLLFLNSTSGSIAFGGALTTFDPSSTLDQRLFNSSSATMTRQLILTVANVPDSSTTFSLFGAAALLLFALRRATA